MPLRNTCQRLRLSGVAFASPINAKLMGALECRFDSQYTALFVVEFDRVAVGLVFQTQSFRTMLEAAQDLALVIAMHSAVDLGLVSEEAQHIGAAEVPNALMHERRIESPESGRTLEHHVGSVFAFAYAPVVRQGQWSA